MNASDVLSCGFFRCHCHRRFYDHARPARPISSWIRCIPRGRGTTISDWGYGRTGDATRPVSVSRPGCIPTRLRGRDANMVRHATCEICSRMQTAPRTAKSDRIGSRSYSGRGIIPPRAADGEISASSSRNLFTGLSSIHTGLRTAPLTSKRIASLYKLTTRLSFCVLRRFV